MAAPASTVTPANQATIADAAAAQIYAPIAVSNSVPNGDANDVAAFATSALYALGAPAPAGAPVLTASGAYDNLDPNTIAQLAAQTAGLQAAQGQTTTAQSLANFPLNNVSRLLLAVSQMTASQIQNLLAIVQALATLPNTDGLTTASAAFTGVNNTAARQLIVSGVTHQQVDPVMDGAIQAGSSSSAPSSLLVSEAS